MNDKNITEFKNNTNLSGGDNIVSKRKNFSLKIMKTLKSFLTT